MSVLLFNSIENLHCLVSLRKLENIRLKDNTYNYTNPGNFGDFEHIPVDGNSRLMNSC